MTLIKDLIHIPEESRRAIFSCGSLKVLPALEQGVGLVNPIAMRSKVNSSIPQAQPLSLFESSNKAHKQIQSRI